MQTRGTTSPAAVPGQYIIGFRHDASAQQREQALASLTPQTVEPLGLIDGALVQVDSKLTLSLTQLPPALAGVVEYVQPNYLHELRGQPSAEPAPVNDPEFPRQYPLRNTGQTGGTPGADVKATDAWKVSTGAGVVVAIADTNIDIKHPDIAGNVWVNPKEIAGNGVDDDANGFVDDMNGWNFGLNTADVTKGGGTHGTHVAGIIGAVANNGVGIAGVAPNVKFMPLPILTSSATTANAVKAFEYAAKNGAQVISNSWGNNTYEPALSAAVGAATKAGLMVVVAAGNESWDTGVHGSYPDNYAGSVSIAASDAKDARASYSNRGTITIDVAAPGDKVLSSVPGGRYEEKSGTSMAAPVFSGVAALVKSKYPQLSMKQVEQRILRSAQRDGSAAPWNGLVASGGRVDAAAALLPIATPASPAPAAAAAAGSPVKLSWRSDVTDGQRFEVQASANPAATTVVAEDFDGGTTSRAFQTSGDAAWKIAEGGAKTGTHAFQLPALTSDKQSRLELTEVLPAPTEVSFWYKGSRTGELSFFVNRELQFQPSKNEEWQQFKTTLPAGEYTFSWLAAGRGGGSGGAFAMDGLQIGKVSAAEWKPVGTTQPGETSIDWTPAAASDAAQVRVRAQNARFAGDWVTGPKFAVTAAAAQPAKA